MKTLSLIIVCLLITGLSYAQFSPFHLGKTPYFKGNLGVQAVQIQQQDTIDGVIHCKFMPKFDYSDYNCITLSINSWLGKEMLINQDKCTFINDMGDSIHFLAQLQVGTQWPLAEFTDGSRFEATVTTLGTAIVFGAIDTIANIQLNYFDTSGSETHHPAEDQIISIGKQCGFLTSYNWTIFPEIVHLFHLVGRNDIPGSITYLSRKEIYNFDIGDVFHYEESTTHYTNQKTYDYTLRKVLDKEVSANGDSVVYTYLDTLFGQHFNEGVVTDYFETSQWTQSFDFSTDQEEFPGCANLTGNFWSNILNYYSESQPARRIKISDLEVSNGSMEDSGDCWYTMLGPWYISSYMEGTGLTSIADLNYTAYNFELVYYQKDSETWGTPIQYMSLEKHELQKVHVYPNPSQSADPLKLQFSDQGKYRIQIYDTKAQRLADLSTSGGEEITIDAFSSIPGLYFLRIISESENYTIKLIRL